VIVVVCPSGTVTGGPEALHQLVDAVNYISPGYGAMCYTPFESEHPVTPAYSKYNIPVIKKDEIPEGALIVLPEIYPHFIPLFTQKCCIWWLSVDNHGTHGVGSLDNTFVHLAQSYYAYAHVEKTYQKSALMLSDYINDVFTIDKSQDRKQQVVVNMAKGGALIQEFQRLFPHIPVVPVTGMSREEVHGLLKESMVYIDFGHHPGKDRMPREAALSGAVVFSTSVGAANNDVDLPIDRWYKFNSVSELSGKVEMVFSGYEAHLVSQYTYLEQIVLQKETFFEEARRLVELNS